MDQEQASKEYRAMLAEASYAKATVGDSVTVTDLASCRQWLLGTLDAIAARWSMFQSAQTKNMMSALRDTLLTDDLAVATIYANYQKEQGK